MLNVKQIVKNLFLRAKVVLLAVTCVLFLGELSPWQRQTHRNRTKRLAINQIMVIVRDKDFECHGGFMHAADRAEEIEQRR